MSLTSLIAQSDSAFKLSQKLVQALAEKFAFKFEDGWATVSSRSLENVQKRLKRERRRNNPLSKVKKPRTAFSFFTQTHRPVVQKANPNATFGELSRLVSADWKKLGEADMKKYKDMEAADKARYQGERQSVQASAAEATPAADAAPVAVAAPSKPAKAPKAAKKAEAAAPAAAAPVAEAKPAKAAKASKKADAPAPAAAAAAPVAATPAAEAKPAKAAKAPKAAAAATPAPAAATPAPAAATPTKAAKASAPKKSSK